MVSRRVRHEADEARVGEVVAPTWRNVVVGNRRDRGSGRSDRGRSRNGPTNVHRHDNATNQIELIKTGLTVGAGTGGVVALVLNGRRQWSTEHWRPVRAGTGDSRGEVS